MIVEGRVHTYSPFPFLLYPPLLLLRFHLYGWWKAIGEARKLVDWSGWALCIVVVTIVVVGLEDLISSGIASIRVMPVRNTFTSNC